jgi:hypothetical protein
MAQTAFFKQLPPAIPADTAALTEARDGATDPKGEGRV